VRAYESGSLSTSDQVSTRLAVGINDGPYRLRGATDATWPSQGYGQRSGMGRKISEAMRAIARIIIPVLTLCAALAALYLYMDTALPYFADGRARWLTVSHLLLPLAFLTIHLTNRRYGPGYAFAQIVLAFAALGAAILFGGALIQMLLPETIIPSVREVAAFAGAFFVAGFLSIVAFDGARGPRWWTAPLIGSLVAALIFVPIFYPAAFLGTAAPWFAHMGIHTGLLIAGSVLSLVPYWLLRRIVQPLPGYGGY
jgi:uncharacterized PurR-regulated membrane protein YhhQ (DUF165 family)